MTKHHAMKVCGTTQAKHYTFSKHALDENKTYLHISISLTLKSIDRIAEDSQSRSGQGGGNRNSFNVTGNKLY
jgi:hypothetical protein